MSKIDVSNKLEQREFKRKQSVVKSFMNSDDAKQSENSNDITNLEKPQKGRPVNHNKEKKERKSLAILPSIYEDALKIAYVDRTSVSEIVSKFLEDYIKKNQDKLNEYQQLKNKKSP